MSSKSLKSLLLTIALASPAHHAMASDVSKYSIEKGHLYTQDSASAPSETPFVPWMFEAAVYGDVSAITDVQLTAPPNFASFDNSSGVAYIAAFPSTSLENLNSFFPNTTYTMTIDSDNDGFTPVQLTLPTPVFPTAIPHISNYTAAQSINPDADFVLTWDPFTGASGNDHVEVVINNSGTPVFSSSLSGNSVTIPAGTLDADSSFDGTIRFVHQTQSDTSSYPGAAGATGFYNETSFTLSTSDSSPGPDSTAPMLFFTFPSDNTTNTTGNTIVSFIFDEAMADTHSIKWGGDNLNTNAFLYFWSSDKTTLSCMYQGGGFPAGTVITWELNPNVNDPNNFKDVAGNPLASGVYKGAFSTGGSIGPVDPCDGGNPGDLSRGFYSVSKTVHYVQTNNSAPVFDPDNEAVFFAAFHAPTNFSATAVTVTGPGNLNQNLSSSFGFFTFSDTLGSAATLDSTYPAGNYTLTATTSAGTKSATLALGDTAAIPVPQILNLVEFKTMNISNDFTLRFAPFTGASAANHDSIFIDISDSSGAVFTAPDECHHIALAVTDTSILIPANTFKSGKNYQGSIGFNHVGSFDTNSIVNSSGSSSASKTTLFDLTPGVVEAQPPTWNKPTRNSDGSLTFVLQGQNGMTVVVESSATLKNDWAVVSTSTVTNGQVTFTIPASGSGRAKFYRARVQ